LVRSYTLQVRAAIKMELERRKLRFEVVDHAKWKLEVAGSGSAKKPACKDVLEQTVGTSLPLLPNAPGGASGVTFAENASDAACIGLWGVRRMHPSLSFVPSLAIAAPSSSALEPGRAAKGKKRARGAPQINWHSLGTLAWERLATLHSKPTASRV
jgi:hypothetical protein